MTFLDSTMEATDSSQLRGSELAVKSMINAFLKDDNSMWAATEEMWAATEEIWAESELHIDFLKDNLTQPLNRLFIYNRR